MKCGLRGLRVVGTQQPVGNGAAAVAARHGAMRSLKSGHIPGSLSSAVRPFKPDWVSHGVVSGRVYWQQLTTSRRQLRSLIMSRTARSSPEGLGARRHLAAIIDRLPQLPSPLSAKRFQKKADSISILVYAVARCRAAGPRTLVRI